MTRIENKLTRLGQIEGLLWAHKDGLKPAEIARKLGVKHRSTVTRCAPDLPAYVQEDDEGRTMGRDCGPRGKVYDVTGRG